MGHYFLELYSSFVFDLGGVKSGSSSSTIVPISFVILVDILYVGGNCNYVVFHHYCLGLTLRIIVLDLVIVVKDKLGETFEVSVSTAVLRKVLLLVEGSKFIRSPNSSLGIIYNKVPALKGHLIVVNGQGLVELRVEPSEGISPLENIVASVPYLPSTTHLVEH